MNNQEIIMICQQLKVEGKEPSVAMIKAKLTSPLAMPHIIAGLKAWRANPNAKVTLPVNESAAERAPTQSIENRVSALEEEVMELKAVIAKLQAGSE